MRQWVGVQAKAKERAAAEDIHVVTSQPHIMQTETTREGLGLEGGGGLRKSDRSVDVQISPTRFGF